MDKIKVTRYTGTIPASGKQVFKFGTHMLCHRSVKLDKCDFLVNIKDGMILHAYPIGTDRMKVVEDVAKNIDALDKYAKHPERYELYDFDPKVVKKTKGSEELVVHPISMDKYSDGSCVMQREVEAKASIKKRSFNMSAKEEW